MVNIMNLKSSVQELIEKRVSRRDYKLEDLEDSVLNELNKFLSTTFVGPFGNQIIFTLMDSQNSNQTERIKVGTYGMISGARYYLVAISKRKQESIIDVGYTLECIILKATDLGLGTCWLGAKQTTNSLTKKITLQDNEFIPAITPIGYPRLKKTAKENIISWGIGARKRKPWSKLFYLNDFSQSLDKKSAGEFNKPLEMVRLAPSGRNVQPWRIVKEELSNNFHFYIDAGKALSRNELPKLKLLDIGVAICHFDLVVKELKLDGDWINNEPQIKSEQRYHYILSWKAK